MERRRFIQTVAAGGVLAIAGCSGDSSSEETTTATATPAATAAGGGGGSDQVDVDTSTTTAGSADTSTQTTEWTPTETEGTPTLGAMDIEFEESYRFRVDYSGYEGQSTDMVIEGRWHTHEFAAEMDAQGHTVALYHVDGTTYTEVDGQCMNIDQYAGTVSDVDTESHASTEQTQQRIEEWEDLGASGRTTIDGEPMWVFSVAEGARGNEYDVTYYVSVETGYIRRAETQGIVMDYWDWGNVGPIDAPC